VRSVRTAHGQVNPKPSWRVRSGLIVPLVLSGPYGPVRGPCRGLVATWQWARLGPPGSPSVRGRGTTLAEPITDLMIAWRSSGGFPRVRAPTHVTQGWTGGTDSTESSSPPVRMWRTSYSALTNAASQGSVDSGSLCRCRPCHFRKQGTVGAIGRGGEERSGASEKDAPAVTASRIHYWIQTT
jgi:hypothetical protein